MADVILFGARPALTTLAIELARQGGQVATIEDRRFPWDFIRARFMPANATPTQTVSATDARHEVHDVSAWRFALRLRFPEGHGR